MLRWKSHSSSLPQAQRVQDTPSTPDTTTSNIGPAHTLADLQQKTTAAGATCSTWNDDSSDDDAANDSQLHTPISFYSGKIPRTPFAWYLANEGEDLRTQDDHSPASFNL